MLNYRKDISGYLGLAWGKGIVIPNGAQEKSAGGEGVSCDGNILYFFCGSGYTTLHYCGGGYTKVYM